jgi:hypothetical protein
MALTVAAVLVMAPGCSSDSDLMRPQAATVQLMMSTDSGSAGVSASTTADHGGDQHRIQGAEILVSDVVARSTTLQQLVDVGVELPVTVDLIALNDSGRTIELGIGYLPPDTYDQIVLVISSLTLTARDGTKITIEPPGGGWTVQIPTEPFTVIEGEITTIQLKFRMSSFRFPFDMNLGDIDDDDFHPEIDCDDHHRGDDD